MTDKLPANFDTLCRDAINSIFKNILPLRLGPNGDLERARNVLTSFSHQLLRSAHHENTMATDIIQTPETDLFKTLACNLRQRVSSFDLDTPEGQRQFDEALFSFSNALLDKLEESGIVTTHRICM